jgi:hypothetical protein
VLRQLREQQQIELHPWTGPLYAIPEPVYALLCGHEVVYYARKRSAVRDQKSEVKGQKSEISGHRAAG